MPRGAVLELRHLSVLTSIGRSSESAGSRHGEEAVENGR
jgi:hypothetical protein